MVEVGKSEVDQCLVDRVVNRFVKTSIERMPAEGTDWALGFSLDWLPAKRGDAFIVGPGPVFQWVLCQSASLVHTPFKLLDAEDSE